MSISIWQSLVNRSEKMGKEAFRGVSTIEDWEKELPQRRREFLESMGLYPWPERCDSAVREYGEFSGEGYRARKIGFQLIPDCWGSAAIYYPDPLPPEKLPAVLYVCGHSKLGIWHYQYHGRMWARRGYVCLMVDTIEQQDNPGEHHGYYTNAYEKWVSLGYSASGGEAFNSVRALDVLAADPAVDPDRIGVTGVSGGGAQSLFTAALDERIKAVSTLCGLCTPYDAIANRRMTSHCDCMFVLNRYGRDLSEFAALVAPRAALFCFGNDDTLFYPVETSALTERVRKIFKLYGREDAWKHVTVDCPHGDDPDFDIATQEWFDLHVAGEKKPLLERGSSREISEKTLTVFNGVPPVPNRLDLLPELLSPRGGIRLPASPEEWPGIRREAIASLPHFGMDEIEASFSVKNTWTPRDTKLVTHHGQIDGVDVWMETSFPQNFSGQLVLSIAGSGEYDRHAMANAMTALFPSKVALASLAPRMSGINYPEQPPPQLPLGSVLMHPTTMLKRALGILGKTPVLLLIQDIRLALSHLRTQDSLRDAPVVLFGSGEVAVAALYVALTDESISGVVLDKLPASHVEHAPIPGILRTLDIPHAVGLMAPRKIALVTPGHASWTWPKRVYERLGCEGAFLDAPDLRTAFQHVL